MISEVSPLTREVPPGQAEETLRTSVSFSVKCEEWPR